MQNLKEEYIPVRGFASHQVGPVGECLHRAVEECPDNMPVQSGVPLPG